MFIKADNKVSLVPRPLNCMGDSRKQPFTPLSGYGMVGTLEDWNCAISLISLKNPRAPSAFKLDLPPVQSYTYGPNWVGEYHSI